jgi:hypothetical protein
MIREGLIIVLCLAFYISIVSNIEFWFQLQARTLATLGKTEEHWVRKVTTPALVGATATTTALAAAVTTTTPAIGTVSTTATTSMDMPPAGPHTIAIYVGNDLDDERQRRKLMELQSYFGKDLIVSTENHSAVDWSTLPPMQVISPDSNIALTTKKKFSNVCCGQERAIMWLIQNQNHYDYVWVIEDDVLWSNFTDLADFFQSYSHDDTDLLHTNDGMEHGSTYQLDGWYWYKSLLPPDVTEQAQFYLPLRQGLFQFFRMSSHFVAAVDDWRRLANNGEWTFFEPLFANIAFRNDTMSANLTTNSVIKNPIGYNFHITFRPCFTFERVYNSSVRGGLFHPVKKDPFAKNCMAPK